MANIRIGVIDPSESEKANMEVPNNVAVEALTEAIVEAMGLPTTGANGRPLRYHLNSRGEDGLLIRLDESQSLAQSNIQQDAILQLTAEMVAGPWDKDHQMRHQKIRVIPPGMSQINEIEVPDYEHVRDLIAVLVEKMNLPARGENGLPVRYHLNLLGGGSRLSRLNEDLSLGENGVRRGAVLQMTAAEDRQYKSEMTANIPVGVIDPSQSEKTNMEVPGNAPVGVLTDAMVEQMGLPTIGANGRPMRYQLNLRGEDGRLARLDEDQTLAENGVEQHAVLQLTAEMVPGPVSAREIFDYISKDKSPFLYLSNMLTEAGESPDDLLASVTEPARLEELDLSYNELAALPKQITAMVNLRKLVLSGNKFSTLPKELFSLKQLEYLNLSYNPLTQLPREIGRLTELQILDLTGDPLTRLPQELARLPKLDQLILGNAPLQVPPPEIVERGLEAIRDYLRSLTESTKLYEAKLIIVGEGAVGKTCLVNKLVNPDFDIQRPPTPINTTEGIEITEWVFDTPQASDFHVNIWDFGGQEIYHATHQFFLTKRSLYLLVWDARKEDRLGGFDYWLSVSNLLSDQSPVIVALNKADERVKEIDQAGLKSKFPNIIGFHEVSALTNQGMDELARQIKENITKLPHVGSDWSKTWADIRYRLEIDLRDYVDCQEYLSICRQFGLDEEQAATLSSYLHDLGVILHFQDDPILRNIVILKPEWGTQAVYRVLDTKSVQEKKGRFSFSDLERIWSDQRYPSHKHVELLQLMIRFELCFRLLDANEYIVPELLSPEQPPFEFERQDSLQFEYHYGFMPAGIMTRFIVRNHPLIVNELYWQLGTVIERDGARALIFCEPLNKKLKIYINGDNRQDLLAIIRNELAHIHQTLNNPAVREMIPCICRECKQADPSFYDYDVLRKYSLKGKAHITCPKSIEDVPVQELIQGVIRTSEETIKISPQLVAAQYSGSAKSRVPKVRRITRILFLSANPIPTAHLRLDEEIKRIQMDLKLARNRNNLELKQEWAVTADTLMQAILDESPNIIHFSGHGEREGIILQDEKTGAPKKVPGEALESLFRLFKDRVECVILNSCFSEYQARAIKSCIRYVIGMRAGIPDKAAIAFSTGFYKAIGAGQSIPFAFKLGITSVQLAGIPNEDIPVLLE